MADRARGEVRPFERPAKPGAAEAMCSHCGRWRLDPDDLYCGLCGLSLFGVSVSPERAILISGLGETAARRRLVLSNTTGEPVTVQVTPREREIPGLVIQPSKVDVPAEGTAAVEVFLDEKRLADDLFVVQEEFFCRVDAHPRKVLSFKVEVKAGPRAEMLTREARFGRLLDGERSEAVVRILNRGAIPLVITSVDAEGSEQLEVLAHPVRLNGGEEGRIQLAWDSSRARDEVPGDDVQVRVRFGNYGEDLLIPVRVRLERLVLHVEPDALRISPAVPKEAYDRTLRLENRGTLDIEVAEVGSDQEWIVVESLAAPLTLVAPLSGGAPPDNERAAETERTLRVRIDPRGLDPGRRKGQVWVRDLEGRTLRTLPVELDVVAAKPYHDYIGIDFGTTNSVVAYIDPVSEAISLVEVKPPGEEDPHLIPSVLTFRSGPDDYVIGYEARDEMAAYSDRTVRSVKRLLGSHRHQELFGQKIPPQAIAGRILKELVRRAEEKLLESDSTYRMIERAIVTVPAAFFDLQIEAILDACEMAGLETQRRSRGQARADAPEVNTGIIIDEPSAAALYYLYHLQRVSLGDEILKLVKRRPARGVHLLVFDYGGGTLDVSLAQLRPLEGTGYGLTIRATAGDDRVGGDRIDLALLEYLLEQARSESSLDVELISASYRDLKRRAEAEGWPGTVLSDVLRVRASWKDRAERAKIELSREGAESAEVRVPPAELLRVEGGKVVTGKEELVLSLRLEDLDARVKDFLEQAKALVERVLEAGRIKPESVDFVLHTGRQSLMPAVRQAVHEVFPKLPEDRDLLEREELKVCVAKGAALYGRLKDVPGGSVQFIDEARRLPYSYGIGIAVGALREFVPILEQGSSYPVERIHEILPGEVPKGNLIHLRIYKNRGTSRRIDGNPDVRPIGQARVDTMADDEPGCTLRFSVGADRVLKVTADGQPVEIEDAPWEEDDDDWLG